MTVAMMEGSPLHRHVCNLSDRNFKETTENASKERDSHATYSHDCRHYGWENKVALLEASQVCNIQGGRGKFVKGLVHCHFAARNGVYDDYGISCHNPAAVATSPPILTVEAHHYTEYREKDDVTMFSMCC